MQAHPDWTPRQVAQALVSSADPTAGESVYDQGSGLVDAERAVDQPVSVTATAADFGRLTWPRGPGIARELAFSNASDTPVTLDLALEVVSTHGDLPCCEERLELTLRIPDDPAAGASYTHRATAMAGFPCVVALESAPITCCV
jgi:hypothetical protein